MNPQKFEELINPKLKEEEKWTRGKKRNVTYQKERWCEIGSKGDWNLCMNWWWEWEIEVGKRGIFNYLFEFEFDIDEFGNIFMWMKTRKRSDFVIAYQCFWNQGFSDLLLTVLCSANLLLPLKRENEKEKERKFILLKTKRNESVDNTMKRSFSLLQFCTRTNCFSPRVYFSHCMNNIFLYISNQINKHTLFLS